MGVYSNKFKSITSKKGPAHTPDSDFRAKKQERKVNKLAKAARKDAPAGRIGDVDLGRGSEFSYGQTPSGATCRNNGSKNLGVSATTGGSSTNRTSTATVTSTPPAWSGNEPDCPIKSQESIDSFTTNAPKKYTPSQETARSPLPSESGKKQYWGGTDYTPRKVLERGKTARPGGRAKGRKQDLWSPGKMGPTRSSYDPKKMPSYSEEGLWGQYKPSKGGK
jgi:hypothetical protein